jgi:hypothetical protein
MSSICASVPRGLIPLKASAPARGSPALRSNDPLHEVFQVAPNLGYRQALPLIGLWNSA